MPPNIVQYNSPENQTLHPDEGAASVAREAGAIENRLGLEKGSAIGRGISVLGYPIQEAANRAEEHVNSQLIGHGSATSTQLMLDMNQRWNEIATKADPNDTSVGQGYREKILEPSIEAFLKPYENAPPKAQEWAQRTADRMRNEMTRTVNADEATRAGVAVTQNIGDTHRNLSLMVNNDPSKLKFATDAMEANVKDIVGSHVNLSAGEAAKVNAELPKWKSQLAISAIDGMIRSNPAQAKLDIESGKFNDYLDGVQKQQALRAADEGQRIQDADKRRDTQQAKQDKIDASADLSADYLLKMYDPIKSRVLPVSPKLNMQILQDITAGKLLPKDGIATIRWNEQQYKAQVAEDKAAAAGAAIKDDPKILADLKARVGDAENPLTRTEIQDVLGSEKITSKTAHDLAWRVSQADAEWNAVQRPFQHQFAVVKEAISRTPEALVDPVGAGRRINDMEQDAQLKLRALFNAHDTNGLQDALNPKSSSYVLHDSLVAPARGNARAIVAGQAGEIRAGEKPSGTVQQIRGTSLLQPETRRKGDMPEVGAIQNGYKFKGGNPADKANWEKQ